MLNRLLRRGGSTEPYSPGPALSPPNSMLLLARLASGANRIAVVDVETTGVYPTDRIVELAIITVGLDGVVLEEWETLIDPRRDLGPTWLHGVSAAMVANAPRFEDVAGAVGARLHGAVLAAHNLAFDVRMLGAEFARLGLDFDAGAGVDTLTGTGCRLTEAAARHGLSARTPHRALDDARTVAGLLVALVGQLRPARRPVRGPVGLATSAAALPRPAGAGIGDSAPYLARVASRVPFSAAGDAAAYWDVLEVALADGHLDTTERAALGALAVDLGITPTRLDAEHRRYVDRLVDAALEDGLVTDDEYSALCQAAVSLGVPRAAVDARTGGAHGSGDEVRLSPGLRICFTGSAFDSQRGVELPRNELAERARRLGLEPVSSVTMGGCDLLVAADPTSASGKAAKARRYGIPITSVGAFLAAAPGGILVATSTGALDTVVCDGCGVVHTEAGTGRRRRALCSNCVVQRRTTDAAPEENLVCEACGAMFCRQRSPGRRPSRCPECTVAVGTASAEVEELSCEACGGIFGRQRTRGRKPSRCPSCR